MKHAFIHLCNTSGLLLLSLPEGVKPWMGAGPGDFLSFGFEIHGKARFMSSLLSVKALNSLNLDY